MLGYRYNNDRATYPNSADLWLRLPSPLGLKKICGRTACSFKLSEDERSLIVEDFALFLRELHAIPIEYANTWNVPDSQESERRMDPSVLHKRIRIAS